MKGVIFNLLEQVVGDEFGEETWDTLLSQANLSGAYTSVGSYPHEELVALVVLASEATGRPVDDLVRWFGRQALPLLYNRYPAFFDTHQNTRSFLLTLNDVIHPEVRKLFPGAYAPTFEVDSNDPHAVSLSYESHRGLCLFAEGLIEGAADHFGETTLVDQPECVKRGDARCLLRAKLPVG
ncbi:MAG: hypothetical protein QOG53_1309 [Frankiales bacterium]|nr:hypothetical protein [Frankiales bacterium]